MLEPNLVLPENQRDLWYQRMSNKPTIIPEDEPCVGLMEWVDLMIQYRKEP